MRGHHFLPSQQDLDHTSAAAAKGGEGRAKWPMRH